MKAYAFKRSLTLGCLFLLAPVCYAGDCRIKTASAPLHAAIGSGPGCAQIVKVKVCAPPGKKPNTSSIKDLKVSENIEVENEIKNVDDNCIEATVTVRSRTVMGPPILQYCQEGSYDGLAEVAYCQ
jgi:hypothetical protein